MQITLHRKWSFLFRISSLNLSKSAVSCGFGHICWRNPYWKSSFFVLRLSAISSKYDFCIRNISNDIYLNSISLKVTQALLIKNSFNKRAEHGSWSKYAITSQTCDCAHVCGDVFYTYLEGLINRPPSSPA